MPTMAFKAEHRDRILKGSKTSTLRLATRIEAGQVATATCEWSKPPFARLHVTDVDRIVLDDLTEADAQADGFDTVEELRAALHAIYPGATSFSRVRFDVELPDSGM